MTQPVPTRLRIAAGSAPMPDRTIAVHLTPAGTACPMSRARVAAPVTMCPLGCVNARITVHDRRITSASMAEAVADVIREYGTDHVASWLGVEDIKISGDTWNLDHYVIDIDGGAQTFKIIIQEVR